MKMSQVKELVILSTNSFDACAEQEQEQVQDDEIDLIEQLTKFLVNATKPHGKTTEQKPTPSIVPFR